MLWFVAIKFEVRLLKEYLSVIMCFPISALRQEFAMELFIELFIQSGSLHRRCHRPKLQTIRSLSQRHRQKYHPRARKSQWLCCFMSTARPRRPWGIF